MTFIPSHCQQKPAFDGQLYVPPFPGSAAINHQTAGTGNKRGLAVLLHGIGEIDGPPVVLPNTIVSDWQGISTSLNTEGWDTVYPEQIGDYDITGTQVDVFFNDLFSDPSGTGEHIVSAVACFWKHIRDWADLNIGPNCPVVPIGFSLGAWTALQIATKMTDTIVAYAVHHPVSYWEDVMNYTFGFGVVGCSLLDVAEDALNDLTIPGFLSWGTADSSVDPLNFGDRKSAAMYLAAHNAGSPVTPNADATGAYSIGSLRTVTGIQSTAGLNTLVGAPGSFTSADVLQVAGPFSVVGHSQNILSVSPDGSTATMTGPAVSTVNGSFQLTVGGDAHLFLGSSGSRIMTWMQSTVRALCPAMY